MLPRPDHEPRRSQTTESSPVVAAFCAAPLVGSAGRAGAGYEVGGSDSVCVAAGRRSPRQPTTIVSTRPQTVALRMKFDVNVEMNYGGKIRVDREPGKQ